MIIFLKSIKKICLDLLFPISCLGCSKENVWLCDNCLNNIPLNQKFTFPQAEEFFNSDPSYQNNTSFNLDGALIASSYENILLNKTIKTFKYNFIFNLSNPLGKILINFLNQFDFKNKSLENFLLIPIPLHQKRLIWRDFNQSELLAKEIGNFFGVEVNSEILERIKNTSPQTELNEKERKSNIKDIFVCLDKNAIKNKKIILIDDVFTTGSTLNEAAKTLKKSGAKEVWGLVLARG